MFQSIRYEKIIFSTSGSTSGDCQSRQFPSILATCKKF
jgi:hypothetical protein